MAGTRVDADFKRRASLAIIWQDLVTPVRAILGYQEIIVEEAQRHQLDDVLPYLHQVLTDAGTLERTRRPNPRDEGRCGERGGRSGQHPSEASA